MSTRNPLDDLPKRHERDALVDKAESDISTAISERAFAHQLTYAELLGILARQIGKWALRQERADRNEPTSDSGT